MAARPIRRQRWLVEPTYQWHITRMLVIALLSVVVLTLALISVAMWSTLGELEMWPSAVFIAAFKAVGWLVVVELVALVPLVIIAGIVMTHRVVGPLGRITATLERIGKGHFDARITLREGDVLVHLAGAINRMAETLQQRGGR